MAADSRRKLTLLGVAAQIATATGAEYFYNYTSGVVALAHNTLEERIQQTGGVAVLVRDGATRVEWRANVGAKMVMDVEIEITVWAKPTELVAALQNAIADVSLVLGKTPNIGGTSTMQRLETIEKPFYSFTANNAVAVMHLRAEADYQPGVDT